MSRKRPSISEFNRFRAVLHSPTEGVHTGAHSAHSLNNNDDDEKATDSSNTAPDGGFSVWIVAAGSATISFCTLGLSDPFGVFLEYYRTHHLQGKSASNISWIGSTQSFLQFFSGMIAGPLFDRHGALVMYPAAFLYVLALMVLSLCSKYWHFMLVQGIVMGLDQGFLQIPALSAVAQHFDKKRAAAFGLTVAGSSIGGVVMPPIFSKLFNNSTVSFGWSICIVGFIVMLFMTFAVISVKARAPPRNTKLILLHPWKQTRFLMFTIAPFVIFVGMFTPNFYLPTYAVSKAIDAALTGYLFAIINPSTPLTQNPHFRKCRRCRISPPLSTPPPFSNYHNSYPISPNNAIFQDTFFDLL
ncbi:MFS general substrate transporter [Colletotrichum somersetense]|nr:MFS general substrate transporter [Colletotrichum somersetense]